MMKKPTATTLRLLEDFSTVLGLDLCFHNRLKMDSLPARWRMHAGQPCHTFKAVASQHRQCIEFDAEKAHELLAGNPAARLVRCPAGYSQVVAGVFCEGLFAGVIFVGPFWLGRAAPPCRQLKWIRKKADLVPIVTVVDALATKLGRYLLDASSQPVDRRQAILRFVQNNYKRDIRLDDLARYMSLSPSRMGHVVRTICGQTFPELVAHTRLREAARLLTAADWPIGDIAGQVGYNDQNYFCRSFKSCYHLSPRKYRKKFFAGI